MKNHRWHIIFVILKLKYVIKLFALIRNKNQQLITITYLSIIIDRYLLKILITTNSSKNQEIC